MNGFERRSEQKKEQVLRAALELFSQHGFKKVSINDIARKADVSPVTIYNHFGSKDGLIRDTVKLQAIRMMDKYRAVIFGDGTFAEKLETIVFDKVGMAALYGGELLSLLLIADEEINRLVTDVMVKESLELTMKLFEEGRRQGYLSDSISNETIAIYLEILKTGISSSRLLQPGSDTYPKIVAELNQLFLYGLIDTGDRKELRKKNK